MIITGYRFHTAGNFQLTRSLEKDPVAAQDERCGSTSGEVFSTLALSAD
jgi:hypothetical protein